MIEQKVPFQKSISEAANRQINDAIQLKGKSLPCSVVSVDGAIITVKFEVESEFTLPQVSVPLFGPEYIRYPIQPGDKGVVFAADARLGGMSGLGPGVASLTQPASLSALVFMPIGNINWESVDPQAVTVYGPNGVVLRDTGSGAVITLTPTGILAVVGATQFEITGTGITMTATNITLNGNIILDGPITQTNTGGGGTTATMIGPLHVTNDVTAGAISLDTHVHSGVQGGSGNTGGPV